MPFSITRLILGQLLTNCYILKSESGAAAVIDPADSPDAILDAAQKAGARIEKILLTHGHFDHTGALKGLKEATGAEIYIHESDSAMIGDSEKSLGFMTGDSQPRVEPDVLLKGGEEIDIGGEKIVVIHTPGHSQGSVTYATGDVIFSGDLIFKGSVGRWDYGSFADEQHSIAVIKAVFDDVTICPGHGDVTTLAEEKRHNPYLMS